MRRMKTYPSNLPPSLLRRVHSLASSLASDTCIKAMKGDAPDMHALQVTATRSAGAVMLGSDVGVVGQAWQKDAVPLACNPTDDLPDPSVPQPGKRGVGR